VARLTLIDQEPKVGRSIHDLARDRQYLDFFPLDDAADLTRPPFYFPETPDPGIGPFGQYMISPGFRRYRTDAVVAYALADVYVIGADAVVMVDGGVLRNTLDYMSTWLAESCVEEFRRTEYVRLRQAMPVANFFETGRYLIGFTGAWRNYGHWLLQCLPKLYAFTLLRRRFRDLKVVLPPLPAASPHQRTLDLLGIGPEAVHVLPPREVSGFASAIVMPNLDIWSVAPFASMAADRLIAGLPAAPAGAAPRPARIYVHRKVKARHVANFDAVRAVVERHGFEVLSFEDADLAEQVAVMQAARLVISEHGANTTNVLFCRDGARVLELFNPFSVEPAFWSIAARRGLDYGYLLGTHSATAENPQPSWNSAYDVPLDTLEAGIQAMLVSPSRLPAVTAPAMLTAAPVPPAPAAPPPVHPAPQPVQPAPPPAPAATPEPAAEPDRIAGLFEPTFQVTADIGRFGHASVAECLTVFAAALPPPQRRMHREADIPADFVAEHHQYLVPQSVNAYAVPDAVLWGNGLITHTNRFVAPLDCLPGYFRPHMRPGGPPLLPMHAGALGRADVETLALDHPVASALHPNLVYGHFLLEMLPRLYLLMVLRAYGADIPLALSTKLQPWAKTFAALFQPADRVVWYDHTRQRVTAPCIVLPSMMHTDHNFHPAMNLMLHDLVQRVRPAGIPPAGPARIYVSRSNFGEERLENEEQVEDMMSGLGFAVVRPQTLGIDEQIRLFSAARVIVGEYGSGLHNAIFAGPGTQVIAINFFNNYQSKIARLRGHRMAFVTPEGGKFHHWRLTRDLPRKFSVDLGQLRRVVTEMAEEDP
jgi:capsular polysaccharide biosynthesis protein